MKALITGASSGFGRDMARILSDKGYDIIAVARRQELLEELQGELKTNVEILCCDVTDINDCKKIAEKAEEAEIFINNAGFGVFGDFCETELEREIAMIDTNVRAVHILTKLVVQKYAKRNRGYILNVASLAAFFPGPLFGAYYATKSYVLRLTQSVAQELREKNSNVKISVLCPGPAHTQFGSVAKVNFGTEGSGKAKHIVLTSRQVAEYAIKKMLRGKEIIIPGTLMKVAVFLRRLLPERALSKIVYEIQHRKCVIK